MPWQSTQVNAGFTNGVASKPWLPVVAAHQARALDVAEADPDAPLHFMRSFLAWRKQHPALVTGDVTYLDGGKETLVWVRQASGSGQALCVAVNLTAEPQAVELPEAKATWLTQTVPGLPLHQQGRVDASGLALPAYGVWIGLG
jgi:alpha-glucosidase